MMRARTAGEIPLIYPFLLQSSDCSPRDARQARQRALTAFFSRCRPSSVRGPVDLPPCSLQRPPRPFPGALQGWPVERAYAPQGAQRVAGSSRGSLNLSLSIV